jgi:ABC-type multidrug transport system permease subunit
MFVALSVVLGTLYGRFDKSEETAFQRLALLFFVVAFLSFMTCAALPELIVDRDVFTRERRNGTYRVGVYLLASTVTSLPWVLLISIAVSVVLYWWVGLEDGRFGYFFAGVFAVAMLVCGFFHPIEDIPAYLRWLNWLSFEKYAFRSLVYNEFHDTRYTCDGTNTIPDLCGRPGATGFTGQQLMDLYSMNSDHRGLDIGVLVAMFVGFRILAYISLALRSGRRK